MIFHSKLWLFTRQYVALKSHFLLWKHLLLFKFCVSELLFRFEEYIYQRFHHTRVAGQLWGALSPSILIDFIHWKRQTGIKTSLFSWFPKSDYMTLLSMVHHDQQPRGELNSRVFIAWKMIYGYIWTSTHSTTCQHSNLPCINNPFGHHKPFYLSICVVQNMHFGSNHTHSPGLFTDDLSEWVLFTPTFQWLIIHFRGSELQYVVINEMLTESYRLTEM